MSYVISQSLGNSMTQYSGGESRQFSCMILPPFNLIDWPWKGLGHRLGNQCLHRHHSDMIGCMVAFKDIDCLLLMLIV